MNANVVLPILRYDEHVNYQVLIYTSNKYDVHVMFTASFHSFFNVEVIFQGLACRSTGGAYSMYVCFLLVLQTLRELHTDSLGNLFYAIVGLLWFLFCSL